MAKWQDTSAGNQQGRYLSSLERENQILQGAISFVSAKGLKFTTRELAEHLGITQPLLYRYFKSKKLLIERIYKEVYLSRWNPEWEDWLKDRTIPFELRLIRYLEDYVSAIMKKDWVRIFMLSAFDDPVISQRYIGLLHRRIFEVMLVELAHEGKFSLPENDRDLEMAHEIIWGFHSGFFYLGVRRWIYKTPIPNDISRLIRLRVAAFLRGAPLELGTL